MTEILVRQASGVDGPAFHELWLDMVQDLYKKGAEVKPTPRTMDFYMGIFDAYVLGHLEGVVGMVDLDGRSVGTILWGSGNLPMDYRWDKTAMGWGTTVAADCRGLGLSRMLRKWASLELLAKGFTHLQGSVHRFNTPGLYSWENFGGIPMGTIYFLPLENTL